MADAGAAPRDRPAELLAAIERNWLWALGAMMALEAALLVYFDRGLTFFFDDWDFVTHDYGGGARSLLTAHVGNISVFPVAVYKVLFHVVGLAHYGLYLWVVTILHLIAAGIIFTMASRRVARVPALLATALILFLGAVWQDLLWAFQIGYLLSIVGGLGGWLLIERDDRVGDLAGMACLVLATGSSSLGIPVLIGIAVELAWQRRWRRLWVVAVPVLLYAVWYLHYGESQVTRNSLEHAPRFALDLAAAAFGGLAGQQLEWGRPLALAGLIVLLWRLGRSVSISPRLAGLLAAGVSLWSVTAATRSTISTPETSRYIYLGAVVIVLVGVELLDGVKLSPRVLGLAALLVAGAVLTGVTVLDAGAQDLRSTSLTVKAELGALELAGAHAPATFQPDPVRAPQIQAGTYLHTVRAIGSSPAATPAEIAAAGRGPRAAADGVLVALDAPEAARALDSVKRSPLAPAPAVSGIGGGSSVQHGACIELTPLPSATMTALFTLPAGGVSIKDRGGNPVALAAKRFGDGLTALPTTVPARGGLVLSFPADAAPVTWQVQASSLSPLTVCGLKP